MSPLRATRIRSSFALAVVFFCGASALAAQPRQETAGPQPCAVVENFRGQVQVMDSTRSRLAEAERGTAVPCGGWVSVGKGRAEIAHRDGYSFHISSNSFVQFPENNPDGKYSGDPVVIYRGQVYGQLFGGSRELRIMTANSRARLTRGSVIVLYNQGDDQSQLVALEGSAEFENRFQPARRVRVAPGEASTLNFRQARVVPSAPRAIAQAELRPRLQELAVSERISRFALAKARERAQRKFASRLAVAKAEKQELAPPVREEPSRSPASSTHQTHLARRLAGGVDLGERLLLSGPSAGQGQRARLEVDDPAAKFHSRARKQEEEEKRKLIEELAQIHVD
ncbi:MAG: hypothetical protein NDJ90_10325 [Oligoflexia bacterium]|nr:hypothetical protein [Oligoflexia bacterium]